jgi:gentisate 1,2-dioxygenase
MWKAVVALGAAQQCDVAGTCTTTKTDTLPYGDAEIFEYSQNANPPMSEIPIRFFDAELHSTGASRVIPLDVGQDLQVDYPATAPNLLASFVRVLVGDTVPTSVEYGATSQTFYVIHGSGNSTTREGSVHWSKGDLFVLPYLGDLPSVCEGLQCVTHFCEADPTTGGCGLYWVHDEPLLRYLGAVPNKKTKRFEPAFFSATEMNDFVESIPGIDPETGEPKNRRGILLGNPSTPQTKTLTPTMWSLLNVIAPHTDQAPHKHTSVALDLATYASGKVYTKLGRELDTNGTIIDPVIAPWGSGSVFITPPGWWHSHHNEGEEEAWVLPVQDAGLYTHQRVLDIRFAPEEMDRLRAGKNRGATLPPQPVMAGSIAFSHSETIPL